MVFFSVLFFLGLKRPHKKKRNNKGGGGKAKGNARKSFPGPENKMELHKKRNKKNIQKIQCCVIRLLCSATGFYISPLARTQNGLRSS